MKRVNILYCLFVFLILTFCSTHFSIGIEYFSDNFGNTLSSWNFVPGSVSDIDSWKIVDGNLIGSVGYAGSSYLYPITTPNNITDFVLESDLMSVSGVDANIIFRESDDKQSHYLVGFRSNDPGWPQDNNNIVLYKYENGYTLIDRYPSTNFPRKFGLTQNVWHKIKLVVFGRSIKVYYDNTLVISKYDTGNIINGGKFALQNWGGNFGLVTNKFDNFRIGDSETIQNKIIFLPGMGGSWNERAMVLNETVAQSEWRMTPFVKNYDSMLQGFEDNGLVKNKDYFVYNYDWRKSMATQIIDFNSYINSLGLGTSEKVDIVGHSMGGVIGRIWTQENSQKVGKTITLGSPNAGAVKVYNMWNGAKIANPTDPGSIALNILLALQRKNNQTAVETIRAYAPALKDLLPTFDYLKKNGVTLTPPSNNYLTTKNVGVSGIFSQLLAVNGKGTQTDAWISLGDRNIFDTLLGQWEQGRPISTIRNDGDGTVLNKSAIFNGDSYTTVVANHGEVPNKSVNLVLTELGLGKTIATIANTNFDGAVFYLGSPATMKVNCGGSDVVAIDGFVTIANKKISDCSVKLTGTDNGTYHLVLGNSTDDGSYKYSEGNISIGETKNISVNNRDFWYEQMLRETNNLLSAYPTNVNLKNIKIAIVAKNRQNMLSYYWLFRKSKLETNITWRMVDYLERIINIEIPSPLPTVLNNQKILAMSAKSLSDKTAILFQRNKVLPNLWRSLNNMQGEEMFLNPNYGKYVLAEKIFGMMWN